MEKVILKKLGKNIAKWRKARKLSQDNLALEGDVGRRTINRIELGETDPRYITLVKIAKALNVSVKDLID